MRALISIAIGLLAAGALAPAGTAPAGDAKLDARAQELVRLLKLEVLPKEAGYLGIIGKSVQVAPVDDRLLAVQSQNYYMLTREQPINYLHWLASDDTHILIEGGPVDYFILKKVFKRLEWTWITFPAVVLVVSVAAYLIAYAVKGNELKINKIDLIDIDLRSDISIPPFIVMV